MVTEFGMSDALGADQLRRQQARTRSSTSRCRRSAASTPRTRRRRSTPRSSASSPRRTTTARRVLRERRDQARRAVGAAAREGSDRRRRAQGNHGARLRRRIRTPCRPKFRPPAPHPRFPDADPNRGRVVRRYSRAPAQHARVRLHRVQARQPDAPGRQAHAHRGRRRASTPISTTCRSTRRSSRRSSTRSSSTSRRFFRDPRSLGARRASTCCPRPRQRRAATRRSGCGAPAARRARRRTRSAMLLAERLGLEHLPERVKIYATDVDKEALDAGAPGRLPGAASWPTSRRRCSRSTSSPMATTGHLQPRPAAVGDLRSHRSDPGCADFASRLPALPEHADVLQRRSAVADPEAVCTSRSIRRCPASRPGRDAVQPFRPVRARST